MARYQKVNAEHARAGYPAREKLFVLRLSRLLAAASAAQELGGQTCWLLHMIALAEDATFYRRPVTFSNNQLCKACGFSSDNTLAVHREKAVQAGWLHYEPGTRHSAGTYWVTIPPEFEQRESTMFDRKDCGADTSTANTAVYDQTSNIEAETLSTSIFEEKQASKEFSSQGRPNVSPQILRGNVGPIYPILKPIPNTPPPPPHGKRAPLPVPHLLNTEVGEEGEVALDGRDRRNDAYVAVQAAGVNQFQTAVDLAIANGMTVDQVLAVVDFFNASAGCYLPGALYSRLTKPGMHRHPADEGWVTPATTVQKLKPTPLPPGVAVDPVLEQDHGPVLDSMSPDEVIRLAIAPSFTARERRDLACLERNRRGRTDAYLRPKLLSALAACTSTTRPSDIPPALAGPSGDPAM